MQFVENKDDTKTILFFVNTGMSACKMDSNYASQKPKYVRYYNKFTSWPNYKFSS